MSARIAILGGGESGIGSAKLASQKGFDVWVSDSGIIRDDRKATLGALRRWSFRRKNPFCERSHQKPWHSR
jgi:glycine/D-amino acid oxidase-like deaminating enzyme